MAGTQYSNSGEVNRAIRNVTGSVTLLITDDTLVLTGNTTLTLYAITASIVGHEPKVINRGGFTLTINRAGSDLINGAASFVPVGAGVVELKSTALLNWDADFNDATTVSGDVIDKTYEELLAMKTANAIVSGQRYKMTDYATSVVHKYDGDVIVGGTEAMYLTGVNSSVFSNVVQSAVYPKDVIHYDITRKDLVEYASLYIEGANGLPALSDSSTNIIFDPNTVVASDTFTITYSQALTFSEYIEINLEDQNIGEFWLLSGTISDLVTNGDIVITNTVGSEYDIQIVALGDQGNAFDFTTISATGQPWIFQIAVNVVLGSNKGTIYHRHDPVQNIKATMGTTAQLMDTSDWRAEIGRRYLITGRGYVAPKPVDYTLSSTGTWGTDTDTYTTNPLDYSMLATVQNNAENITLVGGLAKKNILMTGGVNGMYSPNSDGDSYYQGDCNGIVIEEGSRHACIILAGMDGLTLTNNATVEDIVYKVKFNKMRMVGATINKNWITPDTITQNGRQFNYTTLTGGLNTRLYGSVQSAGALIINRGTLNQVYIRFLIANGNFELDCQNSIMADVQFAGGISFKGNKFRFKGNQTGNVYGTTAGSCDANDISIAVVSGCLFKKFDNNRGSISGGSNSDASLGDTLNNFFDHVTFTNNLYGVSGKLLDCYLRGPVSNNTLNSSISYVRLPMGMASCTNNAELTTVSFLGEVQNQTWDVSRDQSLVHTTLFNTKTWTVAQTGADIFGREGTTLYKREILAGALNLIAVT